jgi:hypothetical protein
MIMATEIARPFFDPSKSAWERPTISPSMIALRSSSLKPKKSSISSGDRSSAPIDTDEMVSRHGNTTRRTVCFMIDPEVTQRSRKLRLLTCGFQ